MKGIKIMLSVLLITLAAIGLLSSAKGINNLVAGILCLFGAFIIISSLMKPTKVKDIPVRTFDMPSIKGVFPHTVGLPIAEGSICTVTAFDNRIVIEGSGNKFNLDKRRLLDVTIKTDLEIQKAYVSSAGGAIGGALLFGPLGALVGGRAKKKETKKLSNYLIFTYDKDGATQYISFDSTGNFSANKFVKDFNSINTRFVKEVEL